MITTVSACRLCRSRSIRACFSIDAPVVSCFPHRDDNLDDLLRCPLEIIECIDCGLVQLRHTVDPAYLYGGDYWYESGVNERMVEELFTITQAARRLVDLQVGDCVLDIGANDGTLLSTYPLGTNRVAVEASPTFKAKLDVITPEVIVGLFPACFHEVDHHQYKVITTIAMFYDVPDPIDAAEKIRRLLHPYGVWVCQFQDLAAQVHDGVWDNFVHEHVSYLTLSTLSIICDAVGLKIFDVERTLINGGSLRTFITHADSSVVIQPAVHRVMAWETGTFTRRWDQGFCSRIARNIEEIRGMLLPLAHQGAVIDLYGASTKGNTLVQAAGLSQAVRSAWERNPRKWDRQTCTGIPIVAESEGLATPPDILLATIWQFRPQIVHREKATLQSIRMMLPLPEAMWVTP